MGEPEAVDEEGEGILDEELLCRREELELDELDELCDDELDELDDELC